MALGHLLTVCSMPSDMSEWRHTQWNHLYMWLCWWLQWGHLWKWVQCKGWSAICSRYVSLVWIFQIVWFKWKCISDRALMLMYIIETLLNLNKLRICFGWALLIWDDVRMVLWDYGILRNAVTSWRRFFILEDSTLRLSLARWLLHLKGLWKRHTDYDAQHDLHVNCLVKPHFYSACSTLILVPLNDSWYDS